jgi:D-beta-D-heptose 7-phosphate kinase/D-beta-D-heptose 1-phosphate adenosyltransferase
MCVSDGAHVGFDGPGDMLDKDIFAATRILVLGDVALDRYVDGDVTRISPEAPVPVLRVRSVRTSCGCAANVAANIAALGGQATLIGVVGNDGEAAQLAQSAQDHGSPVKTMLVTDESRPTSVKTRFVAAGQQVVRADHEETRPVGPQVEEGLIEACAEALNSCQAVVLSDYNKGVLTSRVLSEVIARAAEAGTPVLVDPKRAQLAAYRGATILKPNRNELSAATGHPCNTDAEARQAADVAIAATGAMVLLTRSEQGMSLFRTGAEPVHQPTFAREVFDVSGAGDTVAAVIGLAMARRVDMADAMRLANAAAGVVVGKRGTATVTFPELSRAFSSLSQDFDSRILPRDAAVRQRDAWHRQGLRVGFTNGCFDLIHPGHISLLKEAKRSCDRLIVALNSDRSIRRLKGPSRPLQGEEARAYVLAAMTDVDLVTLFDADTPRDLIATLRPDVLIKGADYTEDQVVGAELVKSWGGCIVLAKLVPEQSTTRLVRRSAAHAAETGLARRYPLRRA